MECESLVVASLIDVNSRKQIHDKNSGQTIQEDACEVIQSEVPKVKSSYPKNCVELKAPKNNSRMIEKFKFTRSASSPVMVVENLNKKFINHGSVEKDNKMSNKWKKKGRNVSFNECVHVLTKSSVIEMPLKNSMLENAKSQSFCKCRKSTLKCDECVGEKKAVTFEREELIKSIILNQNLSEFTEVCQQWEVSFNKKMSNGLTLLHLASIAGSLRIAQFILKNGGRIDEIDNDGWTALHYAVLHNHIPCALMLLQVGADINARTADHCTVIELATQDEMLLLLGRVMNGVAMKTSLDQNKETYV